MTRLLALLLAVLSLGSTGLDPSSGDVDSSSGTALAQPLYPDFPTYPAAPGADDDWSAFYQDRASYYAALDAFRGDGISAETAAGLIAFSAQSTPLALAGQQGKNAIYSPLSLWGALAMLAQCSSGESRAQVLAALGCDSIEAVQEQVSQVWRGLYTNDGTSALLLGNSVWLNNATQSTYSRQTLDTLSQQYYAGVYSVPMGTQEADQAISDWISKQTNGLIGSGERVVKTDSLTLALLASSLYYRAGWDEEFSPRATEQDVFTNADHSAVDTDFMHKNVRASFLKRERYQAAALATQLGEMVFILPNHGTSPEQLLQDPQLLSSLNLFGQDSGYGEIQWSVPKFDISSDLTLNDTLSDLGITDLFDPSRADLSALTTLKAFLSEAKQLARVKADEHGVEGAAVTIFGAGGTGLLEPPPEVCVMDLNRPFLFIIRNEDIPLFIGVVNQIDS